MTLFHSPSVQSPKAYDLQNLQAAQLGARIFPRTARETSSGVTPTDFTKLPGDLLRYGADPTGVADSQPALLAALKASADVFDGFPGGGTYLLNSETVWPSYPARIRGRSKTVQSGTGGTVFKLAAAAGAGKAMLHATAFITDIEVTGITFNWADNTLGQGALLFDLDARSIRINNNVFVGASASTTTTFGVQFTGGGTFTGDVSIRENYFTVIYRPVILSGACTSVRIIANEFYGNLPTVPAGSYGVNITVNTTYGTYIVGNYFQGYNTGIQSHGVAIYQAGNRYESNTNAWQWQTGANPLLCVSHGEFLVSGGGATYPTDDTNACSVLAGSFGNFEGGTNLNIFRGYQEHGRTANLGDWTATTFAAGDYTANGGSTLTVTSGEVTTNEYTEIGHTLHWNLEVDGATTSVASPTEIDIKIPAGLVAAKTTKFTVVFTGLVAEICYGFTTASSNVIGIKRIGGGSFGIGVFNIAFQATFEVTT